MKLPVEFLHKMESLLGEEYPLFLASYDQPRYYGLRVNTLKVGAEEFKKLSPFTLEPIPWTVDGFYYKEGENPGRHPYYHAGLYYIQEPSAMLPGAVIDAQPGEKVLDLCAAPGGKMVQMAAGMKGRGLLVANDINAERVKALVKNIELCGIKNALVTNDAPDKLADAFGQFFDRILVDAPCSGEGMFRKDEEAAKSWGNFKCEKCTGMQWDILRQVDRMLKPGGFLVYSTCTFSPEENEQMMIRFIKQFPYYTFLPTPRISGIASGRPEWADNSIGLEKTARLWPHKLRGEGHFVALLHKAEDAPREAAYTGTASTQLPDGQQRQALTQCITECMNISLEGYFQQKGSNLYCLPELPPRLDRVKVAKFGWYLGEFVRDKFEPSHSMLLSLEKGAFRRVLDLPSDSMDVLRYLKGETLIQEGPKGLTAVCVDGYTLGWAKQTGDMVKNLYPKGWRKVN